jgi:16S rRNA (cytidine1402-2'-O)-methyltransferase
MGTLFIIATPIGNLDDVTFRAVAVMRELDLLLCEDTRVTKRLLDRYGIAVPTESYREQVHFQKVGRIVDLLRAGRRVGLVSDAGTPGIADPGGRLVRDVLAADPETTIVPVPGSNAAVAALSASGFPSDAFVFLGFPPHKKGRAAFFKKAMAQELTAVLYESTHRIEKALGAIAEIDPARRLCVARELTKIHETFYRGTAAEIIDRLKTTSTKGEFVIIISPP